MDTGASQRAATRRKLGTELAKALVTAIGVASACLAPALGLAGDLDGNWLEIKSPNFTVVSNGGERSAVDAAKRFEQIRGVLAEALPGTKPGASITVIGVKNEAAMKSLVPQFWDRKGGSRPAVVWWPTQARDYVVMRMDIGDDDEQFSGAYWGVATQLVARAYPEHPLWMTRGLADFYSRTSVQKDRALVGRPVNYHVGRLREAFRIPLARLFAVDYSSREYLDENLRRDFDAQSWALVHYFLVAEKGVHRDRFVAYVKLAARPNADPLAVARQAFGDLQKLDSELRNYVSQSAYYAVVIPQPLQVKAEGFTTRKLALAESRAILEAFHDDTGGRSRNALLGADADAAAGKGKKNDERPCEAGPWKECWAQGSFLMTSAKAPEEKALAAAMVAKACDAKHADACIDLALWHDNGDMLDKDPVRAQLYWDKACDAGDAKSCVMAGYRLETGQPDAAGATAAVARYQTACDRGEMEGCGRAGTLLVRDTPRDTRGRALLEKACTAEPAIRPACQRLAFSMLDDEPAKATNLLQSGCDQGVFADCGALAELLDAGFGVKKDGAAAAALREKACAGGYQQACKKP